MDLPLLIIGAGLVIGSLVLSVSIEQLMRRFGVVPHDPAERSGGIRDVFSRIEQWLRSRQTPDR